MYGDLLCIHAKLPSNWLHVLQKALLGEEISFDEVLELQNRRDYQDQNRPVGRLLKADDAIEVCTDGLTADEVLEKLEKIVRTAETNLNQC